MEFVNIKACVGEIRIDDNVVLRIADHLEDGCIVCQAKFRQNVCGQHKFGTVDALFDHYFISDRNLQDYILRIISFIEGTL